MENQETDLSWMNSSNEYWYDRKPIEQNEMIKRIKKPLKKDKIIIKRIRELVAQASQLKDENEINISRVKLLDIRNGLSKIRIGLYRNMKFADRQPELVVSEFLVLNSCSISDYSTTRKMIEDDPKIFCCFSNCYGNGLVLIMQFLESVWGYEYYNKFFNYYADKLEKQYPINFHRNLEPSCFKMSFDPNIYVNMNSGYIRTDLFYDENFNCEVQND